MAGKILHQLRRRLSVLRHSTDRVGMTARVAEIGDELRLKFGFENVDFIGRGKDAFVFRGINEEHGRVIVKRTSEYCAQYLENWDRLIPSNFPDVFYTPIWIDEKTLCYPDDGLIHFNSDIKNFFRGLNAVCKLQQRLLASGVLLWDLGFTDPNYMEDVSSGRLRWVDQGGNGICSVLGSMPVAHRENHGDFEENFFTSMLLLHILVIGLGQSQFIPLASELQDRAVTQRDLITIKGQFPLGPLRRVADQALSVDFTRSSGWERFSEALSHVASTDVPQEQADLELLRFGENSIEVRGYQNFILSSGEVSALRAGHRWARSDVKARIVCGYLDSLECESFVDFGSNLGFYTLRSALRAECRVSHGFDYNPTYVAVANLLAETTGSNAAFFVGKFGAQDRSYETVLMLGLIHHVFSRTSHFGDLDAIVSRVSHSTERVAIVEFPTERDQKAAKWTRIAGRTVANGYSEENFVNAVEKHFSGYEVLGHVSESRPIYALFKG